MVSDGRSRIARLAARLDNPVFALLSSLETTTVSLVYLFGLVLATTLYQIDHPTREAVELFIHAWVVFAGPVPLPAGQTLFALLAFNLSLALLFRIPRRARDAGIIVVHLALIVLATGGVVARIGVSESVLALSEGESDRYSYDLRRWDLVVSGEAEGRYPADDLPPTIAGRAVETLRYLGDATGSPEGPLNVASVSGSRSLEPARRSSEEARPGLVIRLGDRELLLLAADRRSLRVDELALRLEPRRYPLPVTIRLDRFTAEFYEGTRTPRSFASELTIADGEVERSATISMNRPLRLGDLTFYQLGYDAGAADRTISVLHVVRNPRRRLPYAVGLLIAAGLLLHAIVRGATKDEETVA